MTRITQDQSRQLDSIRALSALIVLLGHTNQTLLLPTLQKGSTFVGFFTQLSVMVFFVLSGFLIGKSVYNNTAKNGAFNINQYARDRALRLYPPLIAALLLMILTAAVAPWFFASGTQTLISIPGVTFVRSEYTVAAKELLGALVFLNGFKTNTPLVNGPLWSLSFEAWYYVLAGALAIWPTRKWLSVALLAVTIIITRKSILFYALAPVWFAGFALAYLHQSRPTMNNTLFGRLFILMTALMSITVVWAWQQTTPPLKGWTDPINYFRLTSGLWFACYLALLMGGSVRFPTWFHAQANYSYTLYVIHFPIMLFILGITQPYIYGSITSSLAIAVATLALCIVAAKLIARIAEDKTVLTAAVTSMTRTGERK